MFAHEIRLQEIRIVGRKKSASCANVAELRTADTLNTANDLIITQGFAETFLPLELATGHCTTAHSTSTETLRGHRFGNVRDLVPRRSSAAGRGAGAD